MKKLKFLVVPVLLALVMVSCNNDNSTSQESKEKNVLKEFREFSNPYIKSKDSSHYQTRGFWKFLKVLGADITGTAAGAGLAGPVGAVIGGAASSILVATGNAGYQVSNPVGLNPDFYNPQNSYDSAGINHYTMIDKYFEENIGVISEGEDELATKFYDFATDYSLANNLFDNESIEGFTYDKYNNIYQKGIDSTILSIPENVKSTFDTSEETQDIMITYFEVFYNSNSPEQFKDYSIAAEKIIIENKGTFSLREYEMMLSSMSVARIGYDYWNRQ